MTAGAGRARRVRLRSARLPAVLLLAAAVAGLVVANSGIGAVVLDASHTPVLLPGTPWELSAAHVVTEGLLALFFFAAAVELRHELQRGELRTLRRAAVPAIAATGGVVVPIAIFLALTAGSPAASGWPIPTATDIAFALGVLAVFGRGLPSRVRVFLLALAILDDIVGIVLIAVLFTARIDPVMLVAAALATAALAVASRRLARATGSALRVVLPGAVVALALATWVFVLASGIHATIAGVAVGLAMAPAVAARARHLLEPWITLVVLPLFAFTAALVVIPAPGALTPAFVAVAVALPLGKIVGITVAAVLARPLGGPDARIPVGDLVAVGALGGIGFTVSLLLSDLAFAGDPVGRDSAVLGVLAGSVLSLVLAAILVSWRARVHRRIVEEIP